MRNLSNHSEHTRSNKVAWNALLNCGQVCGALESKWFKNPAGQYLMSSARLQWTWGTVPSRLRTKKRREEHARVPTPTHYKFSIVLKSHFRFFSNSYILLGLVDCRFSNNSSKKNSKKLPKNTLNDNKEREKWVFFWVDPWNFFKQKPFWDATLMIFVHQIRRAQTKLLRTDQWNRPIKIFREYLSLGPLK